MHIYIPCVLKLQKSIRVAMQETHFPPILLQLDEDALVSPGPVSGGEDKFINAVTTTNYLLPEYVTGLLLSRNIGIEFKGISASEATHAVHVSSTTKFSVSGGFAFWKARASGSFSNSRSEKTFSSESTSDGIRITIPGAQIIGYYTSVVPEFPIV